HHCRHADHWAVGRRDHGSGVPDHTSGASLAEEGPVSALVVLKREIRASAWSWLLAAVAFFAGFQLLQLVLLIMRFQVFPNYLTLHDWPANIARIVRMTPSVADMIPIMFDEWLVEVGSINYSFGRGIAEWSFVLIPGKAMVVLAIAVLVAT